MLAAPKMPCPTFAGLPFVAWFSTLMGPPRDPGRSILLGLLSHWLGAGASCPLPAAAQP